MPPQYLICVPWHKEEVINAFLNAWNVNPNHPSLVLQKDGGWFSCARTKNLAVQKAKSLNAEIIIVLDSDCYPYLNISLEEFALNHIKAMEDQEVKLFEQITNPPSRGTPYFNKTIKMPVIASMGYWNNIPDRDAPSQLVQGAYAEMEFKQTTIYNKYFALSGMNLAFRAEYSDWFEFIDVPRFDDIWMGWIAQKMAYANGYCFNLNGPIIKHSRQSNVWQSLKEEAKYLELNETLWQEIYNSKIDLNQLKNLVKSKI